MGATPGKRPKVGVGVFIIRDGKILLGKRKGSHGAGEYSLPGGHLEWFETLQQCCIREVREETNIELDEIDPIGFTNDLFPYDHKHYVTLYFMSIVESDTEEKLMEPDKCEKWDWFDMENLPKPHWSGLEEMIPLVKEKIRKRKMEERPDFVMWHPV